MSMNARAWLAGTLAVLGWIGGWDIAGAVTGDWTYFVAPALMLVAVALLAWLVIRVLLWIEGGDDRA